MNINKANEGTAVSSLVLFILQAEVLCHQVINGKRLK